MTIHLIVQYCNDRRPERAAEYDECVRRNLAHPGIAAVHNLVEDGTMVPDAFTGHPRYRQQRLGRWMTYRDAFDYAAERLPGEVVAIANLDVFLDPGSDWAEAARLVGGDIVLCLSRHEWDRDGSHFRDPAHAPTAFAGTQDAWIFKSPLRVPDCDFEVGTLGCDNAIAHRFKAAGLLPINASSRFRVFHYDRFRGKTSANQDAIHARERAHRPRRRPEEQGQYLLPDIDQMTSVDELLRILEADDLQRYAVICDVMNRFLRIRNP